MKSKEQPVKKRAYKKKATPVLEINLQPETSEIDMEMSELTQIISIFYHWDDDQKTRNIRFLASKYWEYLNNGSKI